MSKVKPLTTEENLAKVSLGLDDTTTVAHRRTTRVALHFGHITPSGVVLYLFGTPGPGAVLVHVG
jgi:signal recognition particle receptor subunit beta